MVKALSVVRLMIAKSLTFRTNEMSQVDIWCPFRISGRIDSTFLFKKHIFRPMNHAFLLSLLRLVLAVPLLLSLSFSNLQAQPDWETERKVLLGEVREVLMQGKEKLGETMLREVEQKAWEHSDTVLVLRCITGYLNIHINEEQVLDTLLERMQPLLLLAGEPRDYIEYYIDKANVYHLRGQYQQQITYVDSALTRALEVNDSLNIGYVYFELANAYQNAGSYRSALEMSEESFFYSEAVGDTWSMAFAKRGVGVSYSYLGVADSAIIGFEESNELFLTQGDSTAVAFNTAWIGKTYLDAGNLQMAGARIEASLAKIFPGETIESEEAAFNEVLGWAAEYYHEIGENGKAKEAALKFFKFADAHGQVIHRPDALETLLNIALEDQPQIHSYFQMYVRDQKQLYEEQNSRAVLEYERKYKAEEAEKKVLVLDKAAKEAKLRAQNNRFLIFLVLSLALFAGLVVALLTVRARYRSRQQINELNRKALQLQINPHFFFNVLNSINHYIMQNDQKSANFYLARFAKLMRLSLENSQYDLVEVGQEMDLVEAYLQLEKLRRDSFDIEMDCSETLRDYKIPPLMVQPFVENSVVHAFPDDLPHKGKIWVNARLEPDFLCLDVCDNGVGIHPGKEKSSTEGKTSLAIKILTERLQAYGKKKGEIVFGQTYPGQKEFPGTKVMVRIPLN